MTITPSHFGSTAGGAAVELFTLHNGRGMEARIATFGGVVTFLTAPDRAGHYADVVLGYDALAGYIADRAYFGALIGRYANRIANSRFTLHGITYHLAANDGPHSLHGGRAGFDKVLWKATNGRDRNEGPELELQYLSRDGEEGYPGNLAVTARYTLSDSDELRLALTARTDRDTVVNLTQHSYFNLRGGGDVLDHAVQINATQFTPVRAGVIPTGELRPVENTAFDFRVPKAIGAHLNAAEPQLELAKGYDHNWLIAKTAGELAVHATVHDSQTGRVLEVLSTAPGLQFYSGNLLDGSAIGKQGRRYEPHSGFCLEPQHFPDSPNQPAFPSTVLRPDDVYSSTIVYRFSAR